MVATMIVGLDIFFARVLIMVIHDRSFKITTTYPFACLIFQLYIEARVPIWNYDTLCSSVGIVYIGLIKDEANIVAPRRGPMIQMPPLKKNLVDTVELAQ